MRSPIGRAPETGELQQFAGSLVQVGGRLADAVGRPAAADAALEFTTCWLLQLRRLESLTSGLGVGLELAAGLYADGDQDVGEAFGGRPGP
jgi:hypothetical protein